MDIGRPRFGIVAAVMFAVIAAPCLGQTAAVDPNTGAVEPGYVGFIGPLTIPVTATISPNCSFDPSNPPSGTIHAGDLTLAFDQQIDFGLQCNTPLNIGIVSTNGGLQAPATAVTGYTALRDYNVELHIVGSTATADADCLASALTTSGSCTFRGPATTTQSSGGLYLDGTAVNGTSYVSGSFVRVHSTAYAGTPILLASTGYVDTLTVTLSAVY
jgi:hypothetical protein